RYPRSLHDALPISSAVPSRAKTASWPRGRRAARRRRRLTAVAGRWPAPVDSRPRRCNMNGRPRGGTALEPKEDRRITRTRRLLSEALISLSLEKGYQTVTIRDITERAGVGYATIFRHYTVKEALLVDVLEKFLEEVVDLVVQQAAETDPAASGRIIFEHAQKHSELYLLLMASRGSSDLLDRVYEVATAGITRIAKPRS